MSSPPPCEVCNEMHGVIYDEARPADWQPLLDAPGLSIGRWFRDTYLDACWFVCRRCRWLWHASEWTRSREGYSQLTRHDPGALPVLAVDSPDELAALMSGAEVTAGLAWWISIYLERLRRAGEPREDLERLLAAMRAAAAGA